MPLKEAKITNEAELEEILNDSPEMVEEGFKLLRSQRRTTPHRKRLDLLGVDSNGTLTVVELKAKEDGEQLPQAIEYFDWLLERGLSFFRDYFSEQNIEIRTPRIILIAPEFSERTIKLCKYILEDVQVSLRQYLCFDVDGKKEIKLVDKPIPPRNEIEGPPPTVNKLVDYIEDEEARKCFEKAIELIMDIDKDKVRHTELPYRINFIHKSSGLKFAELYPRKKYFIAKWREAEEWNEANIRTLEEFQKIIDEKIKKAVGLIKEK